MFVTVSSNLSTPQKTFIFELSNQPGGVEGLQVQKIGQIISMCFTRYNILGFLLDLFTVL
jgi:hypothetical protein